MAGQKNIPETQLTRDGQQATGPAAATISLRLPWLRLLHRVAMTSSASRRGSANDYDRPDVFQLHVDTWPCSAFVERNLATDLSTFPPTPAGEAAGRRWSLP